jgi:small conductance mechanosensitive channel
MANIPLPDVLEPWADLLVAASKALFIFVLGWFASKWAHAIASKVFAGRRLDMAIARFLASLTQYAVLAAALIAALEAVGVATTSFVAILGSAALAIGLALQGSLANFASGVMLLVFRPFTIGDLITVVAKTGVVEEIGLFATTMLTPDNHKVIIPNAQVMSGPIENLTVAGTRRGKIDLAVAPGSDPKHVIDLLQRTAVSVEGVADEPAPQVSVIALAATGFTFEVLIWAKAREWAATTSRARIALLDALAKENIALA